MISATLVRAFLHSTMRVMSFIALFVAIGFGSATLFVETAGGQSGVLITFGFLLSAFVPKALQKFAENKVSS